MDATGKNIVVQGHAWLPRWITEKEDDANGTDVEVQNLLNENILYAYAALMNSRSFAKIIEVFSPHVSGGQFDLSPRYVNRIPIPDFPSLSADEDKGLLVAKLSEFGRVLEPESKRWQSSVERLVAGLYGVSFIGSE